MSDAATAIEATVGAIVAIGALGTAAYGLVDASKAFWGGASKFGFGRVKAALQPYHQALLAVNADWLALFRANWLNGVPKDDQKTNAKSLIRLGLNASNAKTLAAATRIDPEAFAQAVGRIETGTPLTPADINLLGRFNAAIDAAMDAGFERGDQQYRNSCRVISGIVAIGLAVWAGALIDSQIALPGGASTGSYWLSMHMWAAVLIGIIAVPIAPIAKDLASSLQAAAGAVTAAKG